MRKMRTNYALKSIKFQEQYQLITAILQKCTKIKASNADLKMVDHGIPYLPLANNPFRNGQ
jgi:hypothetical protein